jgi:hypothetical protein
MTATERWLQRFSPLNLRKLTARLNRASEIGLTPLLPSFNRSPEDQTPRVLRAQTRRLIESNSRSLPRF